MQNSRYGRMILRLCVPAIGFAGLTLLCEVIVQSFGGHIMLTSLAKSLSLVEALLLVSTVLALAVAAYRYWRWGRGDSQNCMRCGGLLGFERSGRWGSYRKCLACGRNESAKIYV